MEQERMYFPLARFFGSWIFSVSFGSIVKVRLCIIQMLLGESSKRIPLQVEGV